MWRYFSAFDSGTTDTDDSDKWWEDERHVPSSSGDEQLREAQHSEDEHLREAQPSGDEQLQEPKPSEDEQLQEAQPSDEEQLREAQPSGDEQLQEPKPSGEETAEGEPQCMYGSISSGCSVGRVLPPSKFCMNM